MLSPRARRILIAAVADYIATGEPVASKSLGQRQAIGLSSASIRAVLAELEASGYLIKPHPSAGRLPTENGLKVFADAVMQAVGPVGAAGREALEQAWDEAAPGLDALLRRTTKTLAELTGAAALVRPPPGTTWTLRDLRFISLKPFEVLAVIVSTSGAVENRVLKTHEALSPADLERFNNILHPYIDGHTLAEVRETLARELAQNRDDTTVPALQICQAALANVQTGTEVLVEGTAQLIERPEFATADRARMLVRTLDDQSQLVELLDRTLRSPGLVVVIGAQGEVGAELSLVAANFGAGAVGVIGSSRMDYAHVAPLVRLAAQRLSKALRDRAEPD